MVDRIYTPQNLAEIMVGAIGRRPDGVVADFSVGGGELLRAAHAVWPSAVFLGTDLDSKTIARLRRKRSEWKLGSCDFLSDSSIARCDVLRRYKGKIGLILLNPPFSCRGGTRLDVEFEGETVSVSRALAFLLRGLGFARRDGIAVALMPSGSLVSQKDSRAWQLVRRHYTVQVVNRNAKNAFHPFVAHTVIVKVERRSKPQDPVTVEVETRGKSLHDLAVGIRRGSNQLHALRVGDAGRWYKVVHTTSITEGKIITHYGKVRRIVADVSSSAVLIPRVGRPDLAKLVCHDGASICLSDCLIALTVHDANDSQRLHSFLTCHWHEIVDLYGGTGAPFLTVAKLCEHLKAHGAQVILGNL